MYTYGVPRGCTHVYNPEWDFELYIIPVTNRNENIVVYTDAYKQTKAETFDQGTSLADVLRFFGQSSAIEEGMENA